MQLAQQSSITLTASKVTLLLAPSEPFATRRAARALSEDFEDLFASRAPICNQPPQAAGKDDVAIWIESDQQFARSLGIDDKLTEPETYVLRAVSHDGRTGILISGADIRGCIYGIYHLAHKHLGADPFKHFTGRKPIRCESLTLDSVAYDAPPPPIRFRGWHVENVTVLKYWKPKAKPRHRFEEFWEATLETLLRCGGNMIKPEHNLSSLDSVARSQNWGLLITQEHCSPFGVGSWNIHSDEPGFNYNYDDFPHVFEQQWYDGLQGYPDPKQVIWTLAHRGRGDKPFWTVDPERYPDDPSRGKSITNVLNRQAQIVRESLPDTKPVFIHNTWMEGNRLFKQGHTQPPDGTIIVWADNGYGVFRAMIAEGCSPEEICDVLPDEPVEPGTHGVYYHVSMWDFNTPFVTQFVPPRRMAEQFTRVLDMNATGYLLVNVGRIRDAITGVAAIADIWNHPEKWRTHESLPRSTDGGEGFLHRWAADHYGEYAEDVLPLYETLFDAPIRWCSWADYEEYILGDVGHARLAGLFVSQAVSHNTREKYAGIPLRFFGNQTLTLPQQLDLYEPYLAKFQPVWDEAVEKAEAIKEGLDQASHDFFLVDIYTQLRTYQLLTNYLHHIIKAVRAFENGEFETAMTLATTAAELIDQQEANLKLRETGDWDAWNTDALLQFACVPMAREHAVTLAETARRLGPNRPKAF